MCFAYAFELFVLYALLKPSIFYPSIYNFCSFKICTFALLHICKLVAYTRSMHFNYIFFMSYWNLAFLYTRIHSFPKICTFALLHMCKLVAYTGPCISLKLFFSWSADSINSCSMKFSQICVLMFPMWLTCLKTVA